MDETPVYFNNPSKETVHYGLTKDPVAVKVMEGNQRARITVTLTCARAGDLMSPCIVECSKNKAARTDAGSTRYKREGGVSCWKQENNTVNSSIMVDWVENWLAPRYSWRARGERVMLIMDSFAGHKTNEVRTTARKRGCDVVEVGEAGSTKNCSHCNSKNSPGFNRFYHCRNFQLSTIHLDVVMS
jgi:hypothetical protein